MKPTNIHFLNETIDRNPPEKGPFWIALEMIAGLLAIVVLFLFIGIAVLAY